MRKVADHYECAQRGARLDLGPDEVPLVVFHAASGRPNVRVVKVNGREIHRCEVRQHEPAAP
jgi:hypothetical protein